MEDLTGPEIEGFSGNVGCLIVGKKVVLARRGVVCFGVFLMFRVCFLFRLRFKKV